MNLKDFQSDVGYMQGVIAVLKRENRLIQQQIERLETVGVDISSIESSMINLISDCIDLIDNTSSVDGCTKENIAKLKAILNNECASSLVERIRATGTCLILEIDRLEETVKNNNLRIGQCQNTIHEVKANSQ